MGLTLEENPVPKENFKRFGNLTCSVKRGPGKSILMEVQIKQKWEEDVERKNVKTLSTIPHGIDR